MKEIEEIDMWYINVLKESSTYIKKKKVQSEIKDKKNRLTESL